MKNLFNWLVGKKNVTVDYTNFELRFTDPDGKEIFSMFGGLTYLPRTGERFFLNSELYQVTRVYHWYDTKSFPIQRPYIEIQLTKS